MRIGIIVTRQDGVRLKEAFQTNINKFAKTFINLDRVVLQSNTTTIAVYDV